MTRLFILVHAEARRRAVEAVKTAPDGDVVRISEPKRSLDQSAKFHAMCGDLAASTLPWAGKRRGLNEWKVLLISGHAVATKLGAEIVPGLEGEFINIRESSAEMSKSRKSSLIEYTQAFISTNQKEPDHAKND